MKENIGSQQRERYFIKTLSKLYLWIALLFLMKLIMNCQLRYRKKQMPFNELEFRRMAEQFDLIFKKSMEL
jgi:hypothetical protein